jgi:hypothetical protein
MQWVVDSGQGAVDSGQESEGNESEVRRNYFIRSSPQGNPTLNFLL